MSALSNENYVKAVVGAYAGYGLAMAAIPDRLSDDHFEGNTNSKETRFFARGAGTTMLGLACALTKLGSDDALKLATAMTVLTGIVFPWNVAFAIFPDAQPTPKYPLHRFPELLMATLSGWGLYLCYKASK